MPQVPDTPAPRGRPPGTSTRDLQRIALRLFAERGYAATTVDAIATEAGTSRRTFFRYFDTKGSVLWLGFEREVDAITRELAAMPASMAMTTAVRQAVLAVGHDRADVEAVRVRGVLLTTEPEVAASAAEPLDAWARAVAGFVAGRTGVPAESLVPLSAGRSVLAACRTAVERWATVPGADLVHYLDVAVRSVVAGFGESAIVPEPGPLR